MSAVAYVVTRTVRHLAAYTRDQGSEPGSRWVGGAYRPLCGEKVSPPSDVMWVNFPYENQRKVRFAMSRPVCLRCLGVLAALNDAAKA